ncbi:hypothetical protein HK102_010206 [Quaeritorhiza haematococci]|nr:hypothetical protein HK102_010206 [Quaeritorhiza haematococci]
MRSKLVSLGDTTLRGFNLAARRYTQVKPTQLLLASCSFSSTAVFSDAAGKKGNGKLMTLDRVNQTVKDVEYAVRGALAIRAEELRQQLETPKPQTSLPFKHITNCNIGNPQQLGQRPITFFRQVVSLVEYPDLMNEENLDATRKLFPADAIKRAKEILAAVGGSVGAYSHSQGVPLVRKHVAQYIEERDGYPSNPEHIFLTAGASPGVQVVLQTLIQHENVGIMIPIPQYPLYTASITLFGGKAVPYYLAEEQEWSMSPEELKRAVKKARKEGVDIIQFCHDEKIVLLADEVYQTNIYMPDRLPFHSFKKVLRSMGPKYENFELISFQSVSKGMIGECGRRGGYFECTGIDPQVMELFYKVASISLCPPVSGQILVDLMVNPPRPGDESYPLYEQELKGIYESLRRRADKLAKAFNDLEGVTCNPAQGAMYLFPQVRFPPKFMEAAKKAKTAPDAMYCMELLNATGVCMVPGSGFVQKEGTWHFRSTFLPPEHEIDEFIGLISDFHGKFMKKYS